jgi:chitin disaccharide deacetylase
MLIINADDWGRSMGETEAAFRCHREKRITSVSAMVFMQDSERAAKLARENEVDVGLHLNFSEGFTDRKSPQKLIDYHSRIVEFLKWSKYAQVLYNPFLRTAFGYSCQTQFQEFIRLYGKLPSHIDGHHHMHLCANVLLSNMIPAGMKMRRNFSFWPVEKNFLNRTYRGLADHWLSRRYRLTDYFFDLTQCIEQKKLGRVAALARSSNVELMTHPIVHSEAEYLMSDEFCGVLQRLELGSYALV